MAAGTPQATPSPADHRESWTCPVCGDVLHVIAGQDHAANHAPMCIGPPVEP